MSQGGTVCGWGVLFNARHEAPHQLLCVMSRVPCCDSLFMTFGISRAQVPFPLSGFICVSAFIEIFPFFPPHFPFFFGFGFPAAK